jgi:hypothetical protein
VRNGRPVIAPIYAKRGDNAADDRFLRNQTGCMM